MTTDTIETRYGTATIGTDHASVYGNASQLYAWAHRAGHAWPCSLLAETDGDERVSAGFDTNGLVDLDLPDALEDLSSDELNAWTSDVLRETLPVDHPCHFVTVGQFEATS